MFSSVKEVEAIFNRFWKLYPECKDIVKIEKCLIQHIDNCVKKNSFAPTMQYFILKEVNKIPVSQLLAAYENFEEKVKVEKIEPKDTKNLF